MTTFFSFSSLTFVVEDFKRSHFLKLQYGLTMDTNVRGDLDFDELPEGYECLVDDVDIQYGIHP